MKQDPIVLELRDIRKQMDSKFPDADAFYEHHRELQERHPGRVVARKPQPALKR
jgi:hypothetical protein